MRRCSQCKTRVVPIQLDVCADCLEFRRGLAVVVIGSIIALLCIVGYVLVLAKFYPGG